MVDDEARLRRSLALLLDKPDREIDECGTGAEAMTALSRQRYDLLLLDLRLPDMTGLDLMDWLGARLPSMTVIVVSADDVIDSAIGALRRGAYDFVRKPYQPEELLRTVDNALQRKHLERTNAVISARLEQSERLHRYLVDHSPDIIYTVDEQGRFKYLNPTVAAMLGYERGELAGHHYSDVVHEDDVERARFAFGERRTGERASRNIELRLRRKNPALDAPLTVALSATGVYADEPGSRGRRFLGTYGVARDISERKRAEERISFQAYHDQLTHLPNRILFLDRLGVALVSARRNRRLVALLFIDLDRFKLVNDTLGHAEGDELLKGVAARLQACLRRSDTLARMGGDEFTILLPELTQPEDATVIAEKVIEELRRPLNVAGHEIRATASIGVALYPADGEDPDTLIKHADIAMYHVKAAGKNSYAFFSTEMNAAFHQRLSVENDLRRALDGNELELRYQPQVSLSRRQLVGMEALVRWRHPDQGLLDPARFISVAEEAGLIGRISDWVLDQACRQLARWHAQGFGDLRVGVNLSPRDFEKGDVVERVFAALERHRVAPAGARGRDHREPHDPRRRTRSQQCAAPARRGCARVDRRLRHALCLVRLSAEVRRHQSESGPDLRARPDPGASAQPDHLGDRRHRARVRSAPVAEGVENPLQRDALRMLGCDEMQGYLFGQPLDAEAAEAVLRQGGGALVGWAGSFRPGARPRRP